MLRRVKNTYSTSSGPVSPENVRQFHQPTRTRIGSYAWDSVNQYRFAARSGVAGGMYRRRPRGAQAKPASDRTRGGRLRQRAAWARWRARPAAVSHG